ncbi:MAG: zinc-binding dehydrogenase, partial [Saprospiraceae bacterium]|nr:zinc-binding dehydrogenase [Saprospiraceae bacterium]
MKLSQVTGELNIGDRVTTFLAPNWQYGRLSSEKITGTLGGSARDGILSEYVALPERALSRFPDYLSFEEAATLPIAALTAWNATVEQSTLKLGDTILITGTGGVSIFALQFAKLAGYRIIVTSSSDEKLKVVRDLDAHHTINYTRQNSWIDEVMKITDHQGVD